MADRVHPTNSPPHAATTDDSQIPPKPDSCPQKPAPPPGTYVIQIPKDQIYRVPPPENTRRYQNYTRRKGRRSPCCCFLLWILSLITTLIVLTAITAAVLYLVYRPKSPKYTVESFSIKRLNLSSNSPAAISPEFDVTVKAQNPNNKLGIYYEKGSSVTVYYSDVKLSNGVLPVYYQPSNNITVFETALTGSGIVLSGTLRQQLVNEQTNGMIPFRLRLKAPVKIKVGSVKSWTVTVKVSCKITVNNMTANAKIVSSDCGASVKPW